MKLALRYWILIGVAAALVLALVGIGIYVSTHKDDYYQAYHSVSGTDMAEMATADKDVKYCNTENSNQEYDLYVPKHRPFGNVPVVIHVHGGGWSSGNRVNPIAEQYAEPLVERGIAFATVDYRLANEAKYPAQNDDVQCAIAHIQKNAESYGIDRNRVIMLGDSAGGHLAALEALEEDNDHVRAVVMLYGVSDLWRQINEHNDVNAVHYLGQADEALAKEASPAYQPLGDAPPFLLIHGTQDEFVPASESEDFSLKLKAAGRQATYISVPGARHAFIGKNDPLEVPIKPQILRFIVEQGQ